MKQSTLRYKLALPLSLILAAVTACANRGEPPPAGLEPLPAPTLPGNPQQLPAAAAPAQAAPAATQQLPPDPWPRPVSLSNANVLVYQPQITKWDGNVISFRSAVALKPIGAKTETFGVIWATARTQVDRVDRMVFFEDLKITKSNFPTLAFKGTQYVKELQQRIAAEVRNIALDRVEASLRWQESSRRHSV